MAAVRAGVAPRPLPLYAERLPSGVTGIEIPSTSEVADVNFRLLQLACGTVQVQAPNVCCRLLQGQCLQYPTADLGFLANELNYYLEALLHFCRLPKSIGGLLFQATLFLTMPGSQLYNVSERPPTLQGSDPSFVAQLAAPQGSTPDHLDHMLPWLLLSTLRAVHALPDASASEQLKQVQRC